MTTGIPGFHQECCFGYVTEVTVGLRNLFFKHLKARVKLVQCFYVTVTPHPVSRGWDSNPDLFCSREVTVPDATRSS